MAIARSSGTVKGQAPGEMSSPPPYDATSRSTAPPSDYSIFPKDVVIYRTEYISLILGPQYEANQKQPPPLFYVSVHMDNRWFNDSPIPQIRLHFGPDNSYPLISTVKFRYNSTSDITIWHNPQFTGAETSDKYDSKQNKSPETKIELTKTWATLNDIHQFCHKIPSADGTLHQEKFEWRHSGEPEVKALAEENIPGENITQESRGLKLVRVSNGEALAVFCGGKHQRVLNPRRVAGKLRFLGGDVLDPLVIVMTILSIMERSRRNATYNATGLGGCILS